MKEICDLWQKETFNPHFARIPIEICSKRISFKNSSLSFQSSFCEDTYWNLPNIISNMGVVVLSILILRGYLLKSAISTSRTGHPVTFNPHFARIPIEISALLFSVPWWNNFQSSFCEDTYWNPVELGLTIPSHNPFNPHFARIPIEIKIGHTHCWKIRTFQSSFCEDTYWNS